MILIADCGSTKIDWCLLNGKEKVAQISDEKVEEVLQKGEAYANEVANKKLLEVQKVYNLR